NACLKMLACKCKLHMQAANSCLQMLACKCCKCLLQMQVAYAGCKCLLANACCKCKRHMQAANACL
ncbi:hypothetical protein Tco_0547310, partial [Tanacetum coccineum]